MHTSPMGQLLRDILRRRFAELRHEREMGFLREGFGSVSRRAGCEVLVAKGVKSLGLGVKLKWTAAEAVYGCGSSPDT